MHDPRFANAGAAPFVAGGFAAPAAPVNYHHHRHRHHKHKSRKDQSPLSRDESIHKVDHGQTHVFQQNEGVPYGTGYGVPYGMPTGFGIPGAAAVVGAGLPQMYPQQPYPQPYPTVPFQYPSQFGGIPYVQESFVPAGRTKKHHRRHRRHHHQQQQQSHAGQGFEEGHANADGGQSVPEQLIGQRSSSVVGSDPGPVRSPVPSAEGEVKKDFGGQPDHHHHHHHRHRHRHHGQGGQSQQVVGSDGYGHINEELIFIERGDHSPHRQDPPKGYDYKGKIEVQCANRESRSQSRGRNTFFPSPPYQPGPTNIPMPPPVVPQHQVGPCPPGWQQMMVSAAPGGPCPPGAGMFPGQMFAPTGFPQPSFNPLAPTMGAVNTGGGLANLAATLPLSAQGQIVADYIVESKGSGGGGGGGATGVISGGGSATDATFHGTQHQQGASESFHQHHQEEHVSGRPTVIEVWQKRSKSEQREKSRSRSRSRSLSPVRRDDHHHHHHEHRQHSSRSPPKHGSSLDLDRFRNEILSAIERIVHRGSSSTIKPGGHENGSQTHIQRPRSPDRPSGQPSGGNGEVRVIVQPIQPVFYMPRQPSGTNGPQPIPGGFNNSERPQQPNTGGGGSGGTNVVYVPRNVYVPVIKPVFVPRERVIVRPQVIHVARPVLVDRPVPVTQRPIIIDRERPIPVPVRGAAQEAAQSSAANVTREEYVYRDNLPVAYGGRCAEFAGGVNYGYMPTQQEHQYGASSAHETSSHYQNQGTVVNAMAPEQFQHSQSSSHIEVRPEAGSFHGSYSNLARANSASAVNVGHINQEVIQQTFEQSARIAGVPVDCPTQIEVLDPAVNPFWQKTDQSTLMRRYGRPAYEIVHKTDEVEQQMYNELRQSGNLVGGNIQRSSSAASYASGSGVAGLDAGIPHY